MPTHVVNVEHEPCDVYIGRGIAKQAHMLSSGIEIGEEGYLGNPHPIGWCKRCGDNHSREESIQKFKIDFDLKLDHDLNFREHLLTLQGKVLGCYCKPKPCHGDIVKAWLDQED